MSVLEDVKLEETRNVLGALSILTQSSESIPHTCFVPNFIGGIDYLRKNGYVKNVDCERASYPYHVRGYQLTEEGLKYVRKVLSSANEIL